MVRTRGGSRYRPRVRFSTPEMEDTGTSGAADAHSLDLPADTQPALAPAAIPEEPQAFRRYQTRMGPRALLRCLRDDTEGLVLPSEPGHQARRSLLDLGPSRHLLQLIRVRRLSYLHVLGSHDRCSATIRFPGTSIFMPENSMGSHIMIYQH